MLQNIIMSQLGVITLPVTGIVFYALYSNQTLALKEKAKVGAKLWIVMFAVLSALIIIYESWKYFMS